VENRFAEIGPAKVSATNVFSAEVSPFEVGPDAFCRCPLAPSVPSTNPLLQYLELAFVGHGNLGFASSADTLHPRQDTAS
jgi:hypothetical protein